MFYFGVCFFFLLLSCCSTNAINQEVKCYEHFTCLHPQRTNDFLQYLKLNSTVPNWYEICNCDSYCHIYGDCCPDAPILDHIKLDEWSFVKVRLSSKVSFMSLMKSKCPRGWKQNVFIKSMCEQSDIDPMYEYLLPEMEQFLLLDSGEEFKNWHVTSRHSLVTYRNLYCSVCNNDTDVDAWTQRLMCANDGEQSQKKCTAIYHQTSADILAKEKLKRTPLLNKVHSTCNLGWYKMNVAKDTYKVLETVKKCQIFYAPVVTQDTRSDKFIVFKNEYCAQCNNYAEPSHQCPSAAIDQQAQVPVSFNLITNFDANYQQGSVMDASGERRCPEGEVYNPLVSQCQIVDFKGDSSKFFNNSPSTSYGLGLVTLLLCQYVILHFWIC